MTASLHPLVVRAREALARGDFRSAESAAEERLRTAGRDVNALQVRCAAQRRRGQFGEAARTLQTVIGIDSRAQWAYNELIQLLMAHGKLADAEQVARAAVRANPDSCECNHAFALILTQQNHLAAGEWHFRRALELTAGEPAASFLANLAVNLLQQGRVDEADSYFAQAYELTPQDPTTLEGWSRLQQARGNLARAHELLDAAEAALSGAMRPASGDGPASDEQALPAAGLSLQRAKLLTLEDRHEEALALLNESKALQGAGLLTRGRVHEGLGRYDEAWRDYAAGKRMLAAEAGEVQYKSDAVEALFARFKQFFNRENLARMPRATARDDVPQPVFIMGFPGSGTAEVERILCRHPAVRAGGALAVLGELHKLANDLLPGPDPFPNNLAHCWTADKHHVAQVLRDYYLARVGQPGHTHVGLLDPKAGAPRGGAREPVRFVTDTTPFNELHLPVLRMAFPEARIIHVVRHPLDVLICLMAVDMKQGFHCAYRPEDMAHHLNAVSDLVQYYRRELGSRDLLLRYEALQSEPQSQRLFAHLGLQDEALPVEGAAQASPARHSHFADQLKPYAHRLQALMATLGYP